MAAPETSPVLRIADARCTIGRRRIFAALSMEVRAGERVHLAGPNGSGKTTALRCIGGTMSIDHGRIDIDGAPAGSRSARISTGLCVNPEKGLFPRLSGHDNLLFAARLRMPAGQVVGAVAAVEREMAIARFAGQPTRNYSAGMRARVTVARALLGRPTLLLMDEPTRSLDAEGRDLFWAAVDRRPETACLIASHLPADRDRCDYSVDLAALPR